jgi:serine/threonine protein kinase
MTNITETLRIRRIHFVHPRTPQLSPEIVEGQAHLTKNRGTPHWMAPEAFIGSNYDERVDVYSLGIVMWEILTSRRPFEDVSPWLIPAAVVERRQRPAVVPSLLLFACHDRISFPYATTTLWHE